MPTVGPKRRDEELKENQIPPRVSPGKLFRNTDGGVRFAQRFTAAQAELEYLSCGEFQLPEGSVCEGISFPRRESLLFQWQGKTTVSVEGKTYALEPFDILYVPSGAEFALANPCSDPARLVQTSAPAEQLHPVCLSRWAELSRREDRIHRLTGKDVYVMFDASEAADKLLAGYSFFQPHSRSWPPHNHPNQEVALIFTRGHGAMEVYESPATLNFVHSVQEGDVVAVPVMNYHPVFTQESPLEFIWCIAGERCWMGERSPDFMEGKLERLTS